MNKRQRIEFAEASVSFSEHAIDRKHMTPDLKAALKDKPKDGGACRVRGAMAGMWEPCTLCGYMMTSQGLKALVVYDERENEDGTPVIDFVPAARIMAPHVPKPKRDILERRTR